MIPGKANSIDSNVGRKLNFNNICGNAADYS